MLKTDCRACTKKFSRRDVMLRNYRNRHMQMDFTAISDRLPPPLPSQLHINDKQTPEINAISNTQKTDEETVSISYFHNDGLRTYRLWKKLSFETVIK